MGKLKTTAEKIVASQERADNWSNMVNGLGDVTRDRTMATRFQASGASNVQYYEDIFAGDPIAHRIAVLPAKESLRQGFRLDLGDATGDNQAPVMAEWDRLGASGILIEAMSFARALGGGAVFIGADDNRPLEMALDIPNVRNVAFLKALTRQELTPLTWYNDPRNPDPSIRSKFGEVETFTMNVPSDGGPNAISPLVIHESRLLIFEGVVTTHRRRSLNQGWGDSIYAQIDGTLSQLAQAVSGLSNALSDADQGIFKLEGLLDILKAGSEGDAAIRQRLSLLQHGRSVARAIALDAKSESFEYVSRSFGGYSEGIYALMFILSASCGIPVTLLFGQSPSGLGATGESDVRFFYDSIKAEQELRLMPRVRRLLEIIMSAADGPMGGSPPEEWSLTFMPLMQSSPAELADIRLKTSQADTIDIDAGIISADEARQSHFGGDEYDPSITLDPATDVEDLAPLPAPAPAPAPVAMPIATSDKVPA